MKNELLFEIGTEEIPAGFILPALEEVKKILDAKLTENALSYDGITGAATPRRLAVNITGLIDKQPDRKDEIHGPPKKVAFDADDNPTKAALGFARTNGVDVKDLEIVSTAKGDYVMVKKEIKGEQTGKILSSLLADVIKEVHFPKSMRWGKGELTFARPIQWILALYGGNTVGVSIDKLTSGTTTTGHRFHAPETITVSNYSDYIDSLRRAHVIADVQERRQMVIDEINRAASGVGGRVLADEELVDTVCNLVEKPHAVCGTFDKKFLQLPKDVLITSMREHQKYFAVVDENDNLMAHFVAINNTGIKDIGMAAHGHQRVLRARLEDAMFFFNEDKQRKLEDRIDDLSGIIFQAKLGTLKEKTERISALARLLADKLAPEHADTAERAAMLSKADLLTEMVNEFPSLQGVMGHDYAILDGESPHVAKAITEHYYPVRAGSTLPTELPGAIVGIADRIDTIAGCFGIGQTPTGTADPFGLRRQSLGLLHIIEKHGVNISLDWLVSEAINLYKDKLTAPPDATKNNVIQFIKGRFNNDLVFRSIAFEAVDAATSVRFDDPVDCRKRINALVDISSQETFTLLASAFKRVNNIIKDHSETIVEEALLKEEAEKKLYEVYKEVNSLAAPHLDNREYGKAMEEILKMKDPVDAFFDDVMVMVENEAIRNNRLTLLTAISKLFFRIGDFSKMSVG